MKNDFYVYAYIDPRTDEPFYIGKGRGRRRFNHLKASELKRSKTFLSNKIRKMLREGVEPTIVDVQDGLSEDEAFSLETLLIVVLGRRDDPLNTGILCNHTDGGGGSSGAIWTTEMRHRRSLASKANWAQPGFKDKVINGLRRLWHLATPDFRQAHSNAVASALSRPDTKQRMSEALKNRWQNEAYKSQMSAQAVEMWARADYRGMMSTVMKELWLDPSYVAKQTTARKEAWQRPGVRERHKKAVKEAQNRPEAKMKMSKAMKRRYDDPVKKREQADRIRIHTKTPEAIAKWRDTMKGIYETEEWQEKQSMACKESWGVQGRREKHKMRKNSQGPQANSRTGLKGVSPCRRGFRVGVKDGEVKIDRGGFTSKRHAARVYDDIVRFLHAGVTYVNIPMAPEWWED